MKYIKTYEELEDFSSNEYNIHFQLVDFLRNLKEPSYSYSANHYEKGEKKGVAVALKYSTNDLRYSPEALFSIRIMEVSDNKLKDYKYSPKLKIRIRKYNNYIRNNEFGSILYDFIIELFKKYSYFNNSKSMMYYNINDFFINTKDIPDIMRELNENFEIYRDTKKYNL